MFVCDRTYVSRDQLHTYGKHICNVSAIFRNLVTLQYIALK
jgi:hypothetical protein